MGEVDAVIPEKSSEPSETVVNGEVNGVYKISESMMDVDTEDDSQISSENGLTSEIPENIINMKETLENKIVNFPSTNKESPSSRRNSTTPLSQSENSVEITTPVTTDENSQKSMNSEKSKENGSVQPDDNEQPLPEKSVHLEKESSSKEPKEENTRIQQDCPSSVDMNGELEETQNSDDEDTSNCESKMKEDEKKENEDGNKKEEETEGQSSSKDSVEEDESLKIDSKVAKVEGAVDEKTEVSTNLNTTTAPSVPGFLSGTKVTEEDGAVIINSDSESEDQENHQNVKSEESKPPETPKEKLLEENESNEKKAEAASKSDDDVVEVLSDKDDCVVIEDDDKKEKTSGRRNQRQRKSVVKVRDFSAFEDDDMAEIIHDSQPPSKRARTSDPSMNQVGQISVKRFPTTTFPDGASKQNFSQPFVQTNNTNKGAKEPTLVIIDTNNMMNVAESSQMGVANSAIKSNSSYSAMPAGLPAQGVFPVNVRSGFVPITNSPPKLVPTSTPLIQTNPLQQDPLILPNLTDDMFVLEAPSFIVPYIYEKPPSDNLKEVVSKLAEEIEAMKKDEKENKDQNKEQTPSEVQEESAVASTSKKETNKKERKKKKSKNPDDSWGESDESTDDDASDAETRTKVLIKEIKNDITSIVTNTEVLKEGGISGGGDSDKKSENYFESPLGKFFIDIGIGLVQEYVQADLIRQQKRKRTKARGNNTTEIDKTINTLKQNLETSKKRNEPYKFEMKRCEYCNFKSESALTMANHYETPHMRQYMYKCNFCSFEARPHHDILFHMEAVHNIKGRLEKAPSYHQCPNCPFEDNGKSKLARHLPVCAKKFRPEQNLLPPSDWEPPAKIPRIKPRHGLVGTATAYQAMAAQAAAQKAALASFSQRGVTPNNNNNNAFMRNRGRPQVTTGRPPAPILPANSRVRQPSPSGVLPNVHMTGGQFIQVTGSNLAVLNSHNTLAMQQPSTAQTTKKTGNGQPSISITPLPRQPNQPGVMPNPLTMQPAPIPPLTTASKSPNSGTKTGQGPGPSSSKASFVICEICDGYIKDLEQLRNHMQWMHKVKIHPKMIYNRPPLNCQKCQFRFFTDQGLERHLLGSHGLVTSSMQEAANKGKDAGRCPVCGRMFQWKLLNHVSRDHHMTLKPAHLSYKCTVCTATFGMYKQFENHVYTAHSTVAKKAMDNKRSSSGNTGNMPSSSNNTSGSTNRSGLSVLGAGGDSLLKPLKINDEITIIPQPATKSRGVVNELESHIIDAKPTSSLSLSFPGHTNNDDYIQEISDDEESDDTSTSNEKKSKLPEKKQLVS